MVISQIGESISGVKCYCNAYEPIFFVTGFYWLTADDMFVTLTPPKGNSLCLFT